MNQPRTARDRVDRVFAIGRRTGRFAVPALVVAALGSAGAVTYAQLHRPMYKSETVLRYRDAARAAAIGGDDPEERAPRLVARLRQTALSRSQLEQIVTVSRIYGDIIADRGMADAVDELRSHVVFRPIDAETFAVSFQDHNPTRTRDVTARIAAALVAESAPAAPSQAAPAPPPSGSSATPPADAPPPAAADREQLEKQLEGKQAAVAAFLAKHPEFTRESQGGPPPPRPPIRPVTPNKNDAALETLERQAARLQERLAQPVAHAVPATKEEVQAETALVAAKTAADNELAAAQKELADKQAKFTDEHPDVQIARDKVAAAQEKAKKADEAVNASLAAAQQHGTPSQEDEGYIDRGALENQLKRINQEIAEYKRHKETVAFNTQVASAVVALENDWLRLARDVAQTRERLAAAREAEARAKAMPAGATATAAATTADGPAAAPSNAALVVVDSAYLPGHEEFPSRNQITVAGVAASLLLGFLLALLLAVLDDRVYDRVDVERLGVPLLSVVPRAGARDLDDPMVKLG